MIGHVMSGSVTIIVVTATFCSPPVVLSYSLLHDSSDHLSGLSSIDEDIHLSECDTILEAESLLRDSSTLIFDVFLFAMSHNFVYICVLIYMSQFHFCKLFRAKILCFRNRF